MTTNKPAAPLRPELQAVIAHISEALPECAALIQAQAAAASVVADSPTMLDVEVPESARPIPLQDGPVPVRAIVYDDIGRPVSEILIWVRGGKLIGLEQAWVTDEPPTEWPTLERLQLS